MRSICPWLALALLALTPTALAEPIRIHGIEVPAPVPDPAEYEVNEGATSRVYDTVEAVYERVFDEPMGTVEPGEAGCTGVKHEVGEGYVHVMGDFARCLPRVRTEPGLDDVCSSWGMPCCDRLGTHCVVEIIDRSTTLVKATHSGPGLAFCIGTQTSGSGNTEPVADVGKDCSGAPAQGLTGHFTSKPCAPKCGPR